MKEVGEYTCVFQVKVANNPLVSNSCIMIFSDTSHGKDFTAASVYSQDHLNIFVSLLKQVFVGFSSVYKTVSLWRRALDAAIWIGTA